MKLNIAAFLAIAGAGALVSASPIPEAEFELASNNFRFGHAVSARSVAQEKPRIISITTFTSTSTDGKVPCAGARARFRQKSLEMSNSLREALGLPPIKVDEVIPKGPMAPVAWFVSPNEGLGKQPHHGNGHVDRPRFHAHHHHGPHFRAHRDGSFMMRLHYALMSLGRWEGRAVAFVLGCGIGVLLRMVWVLVIVGYRVIKGSNDNEEEDGYLRLDAEMDAEEIFVAPPQYFVDEKPPVVEEDKN
ncbi:hypothetical protein AAF712_002866 [Marasmius tenuissimus]|uniref:Uncharacterized protein n=1 Tax=Marasmius tenuissimus TaxID=585030 RepID=A0ABR3AAF5_9AGAR